jgi:dihydroorotate dehydrogenase (fumarate)
MVSVLMNEGPAALTRVRDGFARWGDRHGFASIRDMRGAASVARSPAPQDYTRAGYVDVLHAANQLSMSGH